MINELSTLKSNESALACHFIDTTTKEPYPIIGHSEVINRIRKQISFASKHGSIIFLSGEKGCEKTAAAWNIHHRSRIKPGKFISIPANINNPDSYKDYILKSVNLVKHGTLCIEDVDELSNDNKDMLISLFTLSDFSQNLKNHSIRLVISCVEPLENQQHRQFIAELLGPMIPQFNLHIPPLRERTEDIKEHIDFILTNINTDITVSDTAEMLLQQYDWPGNIAELQRTIVLLASYCENVISGQDILSLGIVNNALPSPRQQPSLVDRVLHQNLECFKNMHPSIYKALTYLSQHYLDDITLIQLANSAYTSPSHLSFLFRKYLHTSFKTILNQARIHFAKSKIDATPSSSITEVCMQSGFSDLSHFEKMFKRYNGCTPRQYRHEQRKRNEAFYHS